MFVNQPEKASTEKIRLYKKLDTRQSEILTSILEIARLIPLRT